MRKLVRLLGLLVLLMPAVSGADVRINELLADPASDWNGDAVVHSRDDEWVEIVNLTDAPIDLAGVRIASADTVWRFGFSGMLSPGGVVVVFGSDAYAWEQENGFPAYGLRLGNTGGALGLWRLSAADTVLIDEMSYLDEDAEDDRSTGRSVADPEAWVLFDSKNPYGGQPPPYATGCPPTPGGLNECPSPNQEQSWGAIKSIYAGDEGF